MDAKAKAQELIDKFDLFAQYSGPNKTKAIDCAIICVEQIIPCTWKQSTYKKEGKIWVDEITTTEYWEEVLTILKAQ